MGDRCDTFTIWRCLKLINIAPFKGTYYYICKKMGNYIGFDPEST